MAVCVCGVLGLIISMDPINSNTHLSLPFSTYRHGKLDGTRARCYNFRDSEGSTEPEILASLLKSTWMGWILYIREMKKGCYAKDTCKRLSFWAKKKQTGEHCTLLSCWHITEERPFMGSIWLRLSPQSKAFSKIVFGQLKKGYQCMYVMLY